MELYNTLSMATISQAKKESMGISTSNGKFAFRPERYRKRILIPKSSIRIFMVQN